MKQNKNLYWIALVSVVVSLVILITVIFLINVLNKYPQAVDTLPYLQPDVTQETEKESHTQTDTAETTNKGNNGVLPNKPNSNAGNPIKINDDFEFPESIEKYSDKFGVYNTVTEESGFRVVTIFSPETVTDFASRRESGEVFDISENEILYLISDTKKLLNEYDIVRVYSLDGRMDEYYGTGYYYSDEYYDSFGILPENANANFNIDIDFYNAVVARITVLHSTIMLPSNSAYGLCVVLPVRENTDDENGGTVSKEELEKISSKTIKYFETNTTEYPYNIGSFLFGNSNLYYITASGKAYNLTPDTPFKYSKYEYNNPEKAITIEVWDNNSDTIAARIRLENDTDATIISEIIDLWNEMKAYIGSDKYSEVSEEEKTTESNYTVVAYFNGVDLGSGGINCFRYRADGNLNIWGYYNFSISGSQAIAEYINALLSEYLIGK